MKVPNIDYSPLVNAQQNRKAATSASFIAPKIETQRQSLQLQKQGLSLKGDAISLQDNMNRFQIGIDFGKWIGGVASHIAGAVAGAQAQDAQAMEGQQAGDFQSFIAEGFANGDFYYEVVNNTLDADPTDPESGITKSELRLHGADKIKAFQDKQIQAIKDKGWMKEIEDQALSSMQNYYYGMNNKMVQDFYAKEASDKFKLEQFNYSVAKDKDINEWHYTDYRNTDAWIDSLKGYTPEAKALLKESAHKEIDLGRAANEVQSIAADQGQAKGVERANAISDERGYDADTRRRLIGYANGAAQQARLDAQNAGTQFATSIIEESKTKGVQPDFGTVWGNINDRTMGMNPERETYYKAGVESAQLGYITQLGLEKTKGIDDMTIDQLKDGLEEINGMDSVFEGTEATRAAGEKIKGEFTKRIKAFNDTIEKMDNASKEILENEYKTRDALVNNIVSRYENDALNQEDYLKELAEQQQKNFDAAYSYDKKLKIDTKIRDKYTNLDKEIKAKEDKETQEAYDLLDKEIAQTKEEVKQGIIGSDELKQQIMTYAQTNAAGTWSDAKKIDINTKLLQLAGESDKTQDKKSEEIRGQYSSLAEQSMQSIYDKYARGEIGSNKAKEEIMSVIESTSRLMGNNYQGLAFTFKEMDDLNKKQNQFIHKLMDEKNIPQKYKDMINERMKGFESKVYAYFDNYPGADADSGNIAEDILSNTKSMLMDLVRDADSEVKPEDFSRELDSISVFFEKNLYTKLSTPETIGMGDTPEGNAYKTLREFENYPQAYRYNEDKGHYIWLSQSMKKNFDNAAIQARNDAEKMYGIELDHEKPVEYVKVNDRYFNTSAKESGLVPLFYAKDKGEDGETDEFIIQDGLLYRYDPATMTATRYYSSKKGL